MTRADDHPGVPLAHYIDHHPSTGVRIHCTGCAAARDVPMATMVAGLARRGLDPRTTGIRAIGGLLTAPCRRCGQRAWRTAPAFETTPRPRGRLG